MQTENSPYREDIHSFLYSIHLLQFSRKLNDFTDTPVTVTKLYTALKLILDNRAPGPDCSLLRSINTWSILAPFKRLLTEIKQNSRKAANMNIATILLLLKPNKGPTQPLRYCLISLISVDIKVISQTLAYRIERMISSVICCDQLHPSRHPSSNTRLFNLNLYNKQQHSRPSTEETAHFSSTQCKSVALL